MTKTEIKVICLQAGTTGNTTTPEYVLRSAKEYFDWIIEDVEFCPHCGEEGGACDNEDDCMN